MMKDIITRYLQGQASEEEKKFLLNWIRESKANKKTFNDMYKTWQLSSQTIKLDVNVKSAFLRFKTNVIDYENSKNRVYKLFILKIAASVAILILCVGGGYYLGKKDVSNLIITKDMLVMNQVIMGKDNKGSVILPDGSLVWLNSNSKLIYPEKFSESARKVKLEGEGYFEVIHNSEAPFYVETSNMTVNVLGTHFDVRSYLGKGISETILISGKVEVLFPNNKKSIILKPNQKITCSKESGSFKVTDVDASDYAIWINDKLTFTNETLSVILNRMEHWYGVEFICDKRILMNQRLSLTVRKESKDEIMKLIGLIAHIDFEIDNDKIFIHPKKK